jgi:hypothetical protein
MTVYLPRQLGLIAPAVVALTIGWAATGEAQVIYPYPYPPPYHYAYGQPLASVRIEVTPKEAEVYVDGFYAGIVDDFDGVFQRLHTTPGAHTITLYLDGYRTVTQQLYLPPDDTFKVKYKMEPLRPGETPEARPVPPSPPPGPEAGVPIPGPRRRGGYPPYGPGPYGPPPYGPPPPNAPAPNEPPPPPAPPVPNAPPPPGTARGAQPAGTGMISLRVQPSDADVLIDGQVWHVPSGQDRLMVDASAGTHSIQVRKAGYVGYLTDVFVHGNETATLDVNLRRLQ